MDLLIETSYKISDQEFALLRDLIHQLTGINLTNQKKMLVVARLSKRLHALGLNNFMEYYSFMTTTPEGQRELKELINRITTNKTDFYRERHHFDYLEKVLLPQLFKKGVEKCSRSIKIWSAGCSTGEEPYTISITLNEFFKRKPSWNLSILATDLDTDVLKKAMSGIYKEQDVNPIPAEYLRSYFKRGVDDNHGLYLAKKDLKELIAFRRHNMIKDDLPGEAPFDIIFCRNVIIYFDDQTKNRLLHKFHSALKPDGHLFLGHSEALLGSDVSFELVTNSGYRKTFAG